MPIDVYHTVRDQRTTPVPFQQTSTSYTPIPGPTSVSPACRSVRQGRLFSPPPPGENYKSYSRASLRAPQPLQFVDPCAFAEPASRRLFPKMITHIHFCFIAIGDEIITPMYRVPCILVCVLQLGQRGEIRSEILERKTTRLIRISSYILPFVSLGYL